MIGLLQRVSQAEVRVQGERIAVIAAGLLVFVGIERDDSFEHGRKLLERLLSYRVFGDTQGRMNRSLRDVGGGLLLVPQFTLTADTRKGLRPGFDHAAPAETARPLFDRLVIEAQSLHTPVACGSFGADMQVILTNDGPVTFWLST